MQDFSQLFKTYHLLSCLWGSTHATLPTWTSLSLPLGLVTLSVLHTELWHHVLCEVLSDPGAQLGSRAKRSYSAPTLKRFAALELFAIICFKVYNHYSYISIRPDHSTVAGTWSMLTTLPPGLTLNRSSIRWLSVTLTEHLQASSHLSTSTTLWGRYRDFSHFTEWRRWGLQRSVNLTYVPQQRSQTPARWAWPQRHVVNH